jgi:SAM-dependent methyltransferase
MSSYTTDNIKIGQLLSNGILQVKSILSQKRKIQESGDKSSLLDHSKWIGYSSQKLTNVSLDKLRILEVGHGQMPVTLAYFASLGNEVYGIDMDRTIQGKLDLVGYYACLKENGFLRMLKSIVKETTGINDVLRSEFLKQCGIDKWPKLHLIQGDAKKMPFPDNHFDFVFSIAVFEHLDDPGAVLDEIIRVLKPGAKMWLAFPHFEHPNALHDLRWINRSETAPPPWSHLIPEYKQLVHQGAFINTLREKEWIALFQNKCQGVIFDKRISTDDRLEGVLSKYRELGYLQGYNDNELLTEYFIVAWERPR